MNSKNIQSPEYLDLFQYLSALWRWAWLVLLTGALAGVTAYLVASYMTPIYEADTTVLVNVTSSSNMNEFTSLQLSSQLSQTYAQMMVKSPVLKEVAKRLEIPPIDPLSITANTLTNTQLINLTVESTNPSQAAEIANEIIVVFTEQLESIRRERYATSKQSLQSRIEEIESQILETSQQILQNENSEEKNQLSAELDLLKQTYSSLLSSYQQIRLAEVNTDFTEDEDGIQAQRISDLKFSLQTQINNLEKDILATTKSISQDANPEEKTKLAAKLDFYQKTYSSLLQSLEQVQLVEDQSFSTIVQVEPASIPAEPSQPQTFLYVVIAIAVGLILAAIMIYFIGILDDTLKTPEEFTEKLGLPVLGIIPHHKIKNGVPITESQPRSLVSEAFRTLRTNVQFASAGNLDTINTILVTSTNHDEGKTTVLVNLAVVMAQNERKVTLVDADLRKPTVHNYLNLNNEIGLSQIFLDGSPDKLSKMTNKEAFSKSSLLEILHPTQVDNLSVVTAGQLPPNPSELLGSPKMKEFLSTLKATADIVLIDTPPVLAVTDATVLLPNVQGVVLVMKPGSTHQKAARQLVDLMQRLDANILGIVLNDVKIKEISHYYYYGKSKKDQVTEK